MKNNGFSIVELLICVAIIGVISSIGFPIYKNYSDNSKLKGCFREVKSYADGVFVDLNVHGIDLVKSPIVSVCKTITDASEWTDQTTKFEIIALPNMDGAEKIICNIKNGVECTS